MTRLSRLIVILFVALLWQMPARASGDFTESPTWKLDHRAFSEADNMALLGPANDTRVNLMLLLLDLHAKSPMVAASQDPMFEWGSMKDLLFPKPAGADESYADGEGSRCKSNNDGIGAFEAAVTASRMAPDERSALIAARRTLRPDCAKKTDDGAVTAAVASLKSAEAKAFARYLQGALAFYDGDFDRAAAQFGGLANAGDPWLKETACYMLGRVEVNRAQIGAFDEYGSPANFAKIDRKVIAAGERALTLYLQQFPRGRYAASARGLLRRVYWLGGDNAKLSALYAGLLAQPAASRGIDDVALIEEIDLKLLPSLKVGEISDPLLLAVADLQNMRAASDESSAAKPIALADLQAQRPKFASNPALFDYLLAARAVFVANDPRTAIQLVPDASHQPNFSYLQFSRQALRGMALEAVKDRNARGFWVDIISGAKALYQRPAVELALAWHDERTGGLAKVFASDSPVQNRSIRDILLMNVAGPSLLRQQVKSSTVSKHERELALFTLLYKDLTRASYQSFLDDLALVPAKAPVEINNYNLRDEDDIGVGLFVQSNKLGDYGCPVLRATATALVGNPRAPKPLLCLADFMRDNGFDDFVLDSGKSATDLAGEKRPRDELGDTTPEFPGGVFSRLEIYKGILVNPTATANDKAYALYRAINCYGPSGNNSCGGVEVPKAQRKAWFTRLKAEFATTSWAKDQKYYW